jgi:hypothetical protein
MHSRTISILRQLEKASWFSRVGINEGSSAVFVTSWSDAIEQCDSFEWEDLRLDALNQFRACIARQSKERFHLWNRLVDEVKEIVDPLVSRKISMVVQERNLPEIFKIRVSNDVSCACMETEYADLCPPGFFTSISQWYINGHFPCGWWGAFPLGKLVVY